MGGASVLIAYGFGEDFLERVLLGDKEKYVFI